MLNGELKTIVENYKNTLRMTLFKINEVESNALYAINHADATDEAKSKARAAVEFAANLDRLDWAKREARHQAKAYKQEDKYPEFLFAAEVEAGFHQEEVRERQAKAKRLADAIAAAKAEAEARVRAEFEVA